MMPSLAAQLEADSIELWFHCCSPLDNWGVYETLTDALIEAKTERRRALAAGDHAARLAAEQEVLDLTELAAACAEGLALQRARFIAGGHLWPLAPVA